MKSLFKISTLTILLAFTSCAHHKKCADKSQCDMKKGECCKEQAQCSMMKKEAPAEEAKK